MIDRENELINHRITWLTTMQGLLFASLGFAWDKPTARPLIQVLCVLGVAISVVQFCALIASTTAIGRLFDWWENNKPQDYNGPDVAGWPPAKSLILRYMVFWNWVPLLFLGAWAVIWFVSTG
jgi:hypothetical protein